MMDFGLSEDERFIGESVRAMAQDRLADGAGTRDHQGVLDEGPWDALGALGLFEMALEPGSARGKSDGDDDELGARTLTVVLEALGAHDAATGLMLAEHLSWTLPALRQEPSLKTEARQAAEGALSMAWTWRREESGASAKATPAPSLPIEAQEEADGVWCLNGVAETIAGATRAQQFAVEAQTPSGRAIFIIPAGTKGLSASSLPAPLAFRGAHLGDLHLNGTPARRIMLKNDALARFAAERKPLYRLALSALTLGIGARAMAEAANYALERKQFGKSIASFQAIQFKLADMATALDAAKMLVRYAAWAFDRGNPSWVSAAQKALVAACSAAQRSSDEALQIHGGTGYTREVPVERLWREARALDALAGGCPSARQEIALAILGQRA